MSNLIDPKQFGVSFSIKQCRNFDIDPDKTLKWLIEDAGFRRFRLMSYWNEHEKEPGQYNFDSLNKQINRIIKADGEITLCLGVRQPRWPENHWPTWAWKMNSQERTVNILKYVEKVAYRYKIEPNIKSFQLENEALLKNFGERSDVDRSRLKAEYKLVKKLDKNRPIIMTTSTSWGIPIRQPIPDMIGFSYYHTLYRDGAYHHSLFYPWVHKVRKKLIKIIHNRPVFIHELQLEPWGPTAIWKMSLAEQAMSMSVEYIKQNISLVKRIEAPPIDLWGGEWWYWRLIKHKDPSIWDAVCSSISASKHST